MDKFELTISNMPATGKRGWVKKGDTFLKADSQSSHGASTQKLTFLLEDGLYEVQDANFGSRRTNRYWLQVHAGEGIEVEKPKEPSVVGLPELTGSGKQITWAQDIRAKALKALSAELPAILIQALGGEETEAKWWIDNRNHFPGLLKQRAKNKVVKYPVKQWEDFLEEYAHEGEGGEWVYRSESLPNKDLSPGAGDELEITVCCQTRKRENGRLGITLLQCFR